MQGRLVTRPLTAAAIAHERRRMMVTKASNRAAVHGTRLPAGDALDKDEAEKEINEKKQEKQKKREEIEKAVDSKINSSDVPLSPVK